MGALGKGNPIPYKLGGGPSNTEQAYSALKQAAGIGGVSPEGTIRAEWLLAKSRGLAAIMADERAVNQMFPDTATDFLPVYEEILDAPPSPNLSDQTRREEATRLWVLSNTSVNADLEDALQDVDENFTVESIDRQYTTITQNGRVFQDYNPVDPDASGPPFNIGKQTDYPNYSTEFKCYINYGVSGTPTAQDYRKMEDAKGVLRDRLPAWISFEIFKGIGFFLDIDLLDLGVFGNYPAGTIYPP